MTARHLENRTSSNRASAALALQVLVDGCPSQAEFLSDRHRICTRNGHPLLQCRNLLRRELVPSATHSSLCSCGAETGVDQLTTTSAFESIQLLHNIQKGRGIECRSAAPCAHVQFNIALHQVGKCLSELFQGKAEVPKAWDYQSISPTETLHARAPARGRALVRLSGILEDLRATRTRERFPLLREGGVTANGADVSDFASHGRDQQMNPPSLPGMRR